MNVNGMSAFGRALLTSVQRENSAFVVLIKNVVLDFIALCVHEKRSPLNHSGHAVSPDKFTFGVDASVKKLFTGAVDGAAASKGYSMTLHYAKSYRPFEYFVNENYKLRDELKLK